MLVTCMITVLVRFGGAPNGIPFIVKTQVEGKVIKSNSDNLLVDFSKEAKKHPWTGDYSKVLVHKDQCI